MLEFSSMAQDFVEATSSLVGGRTINIMDREGTIIASNGKGAHRHLSPGAAEVIATGKPVLIETKDLPRYPGAKEAITCPSSEGRTDWSGGHLRMRGTDAERGQSSEGLCDTAFCPAGHGTETKRGI